MKTQRQIVLEMLEAAGPRGLHSFEFIQARIPRVAARVCELRAEGWDIGSEREALHGAAEGVRYTLNVGVGAEGQGGDDASSEGSSPFRSTDSGVEDSASPAPPAEAPPESLFDLPPAPSAFDPWERAA